MDFLYPCEAGIKMAIEERMYRFIYSGSGLIQLRLTLASLRAFDAYCFIRST